jgi:hypothetical protein
MNQPPSANNNSSGNNSNRRRRRPSNNRPKKSSDAAAPAATSPNTPSGNSSRSRRGGRGRRSRGANNNTKSNSVQLRGMDLVRAKYLTFVEKHVEARRKYYDFFYRADPNQLRKLEKEFTDSQAELLAYEESLSPQDREQLVKDYGGRPEDRAYTTNHNLSPLAENVPTEGDFEDPHVLESQKKCDFNQDREESIGTIEDYKRLKGL